MKMEDPFRPWLLQIVANEARNRRRADLRHPTLELIEATERPDHHLDSSPEELALSRERQQGLVDALNELSEEDRAVISMRYLLDLSEKEMATTLQIPPGTVKSRLSRALRRARAVLDARGTSRSGQDV
jgi:RNA polymerase sigma factor (sigma-70 family)